jgi:hypothetical protein
MQCSTLCLAELQRDTCTGTGTNDNGIAIWMLDIWTVHFRLRCAPRCPKFQSKRSLRLASEQCTSRITVLAPIKFYAIWVGFSQRWQIVWESVRRWVLIPIDDVTYQLELAVFDPTNIAILYFGDTCFVVSG